MKIIISCLTSLAILTFPFQGRCSHYRDCCTDRSTFNPDSEDTSFLLCHFDYFRYSRCLLQIDLIKRTPNKEKRDRIKTILEIDLLCLMDRAQFQIEDEEDNLVYQYKMRDEGHSPSKEYWKNHILKTLDRLENNHQIYRELENLIEQYTR